MTKNLLFAFAFSTFSLSAIGQANIWTQITGNGFGYPGQNTVPEMEVFNGNIYASTSPTGSGLAKLWHSASGASGTWSDSAIFTPPLNGDISMHSFGTTTLGGGYIWLGTGSIKGGAIYRSQNGINWIKISPRGFGNDSLKGATPHMMVFQGSGDTIPHLYAGMISHGAGTPAQVWRTPYTNTDSTQWTQLVDFASVDSGVQTVSYFEVWNNKIYFGTDDGGQLWESTDGINFTKNTGVGNGFGYLSNKVIASIEVFNNEMYLTTNNPFQGGHIWKSADGTNWDSVTVDGFGMGNSAFELRSIRESFGKLWATAYTDTATSNGTPLWRSDDGINWVQSNTDGFGNILNNGENAVTIGFGNYQYFGGPNYNAGGQVWRTDMTTGIEEETKNCETSLYPNPATNGKSITIQANCNTYGQIQIYDLHGRLIETSFLFSNGKVELNSKEYESGIYFYRLLAKNGTVITGKFIIGQ